MFRERQSLTLATKRSTTSITPCMHGDDGMGAFREPLTWRGGRRSAAEVCIGRVSGECTGKMCSTKGLSGELVGLVVQPV